MDQVADQLARLFVSLHVKYGEISPYNKFLASEFWGLIEVPDAEAANLTEAILERVFVHHHSLTGSYPSQRDLDFYYRPIIETWLWLPNQETKN